MLTLLYREHSVSSIKELLPCGNLLIAFISLESVVKILLFKLTFGSWYFCNRCFNCILIDYFIILIFCYLFSAAEARLVMYMYINVVFPYLGPFIFCMYLELLHQSHIKYNSESWESPFFFKVIGSYEKLGSLWAVTSEFLEAWKQLSWASMVCALLLWLFHDCCFYVKQPAVWKPRSWNIKNSQRKNSCRIARFSVIAFGIWSMVVIWERRRITVRQVLRCSLV